MSKTSAQLLLLTLISLQGIYIVSARGSSMFSCNTTVDHDMYSLGREVDISITAVFDAQFGGLKVEFGADAGIYANKKAVGWCVDPSRYISIQTYKADTYSTYNITGIPTGAVDKPHNLDMVNYLVNTYSLDQVVSPGNGCPATALTWREIQVAIWKVIDDTTVDVGAVQCIVDYIYQDTTDHGNNYEPCNNSNEKLAVMIVIDDDNVGGATTGTITNQVIIAELPLLGGGAKGDPHFKTWTGEMYDFHGVCDLVLLQNSAYKNGLGMDIHLRTRKTRNWSYISAAVIKIGDETLEVMGGEQNLYWLNGIAGDEELLSTTISGHSIQYRNPNPKIREFEIDLGHGTSITVKTWHGMVRVDVNQATAQKFADSLGLMGAFPSGVRIARDGQTVIEDNNFFGQEWQVLASEPKLFHDTKGPQAPIQCEIPTKMALRRRLSDSIIRVEIAAHACEHIKDKDEFDLCVFDVMATNDKYVAGAY